MRLASPAPEVRRRAFTLVEVSITSSLLTVLSVGLLSAIAGSQRAVVDDHSLFRLHTRAQHALDRLHELSSQALSNDSAFALTRPAAGGDFHGLDFRLVRSVGAAGTVDYDPSRVIIVGPSDGAPPAAGLVVGRGADLAEIEAAAVGPDGSLGTTDDDFRVSLDGSHPALELLVPRDFAPRTGDMFRVTFQPGSDRRLLVFTLRLNARLRDGEYLLDEDLVLIERVSLRR